MPDVLAQEIPQYVPILFGGLFDNILLGLPVYIWIFVAMGGSLFFGIIIMLYIKKTMDPVWGYFNSARKGEPLAILITKNKKMRFIEVEYVAGIFEAIGMPLKWINLSTKAAGQLGICNTIIIDDVCGIVDSPDHQLAMMEIKDAWNDSHPDNKIKNFEDFVELWMKDQFSEDDTIKLPPLAAVPIWEIKQYTQPVSSAHVDAWAVNEANEYKDNIEKPNPWPFYILTGLGALIFIMSLIMTYVMKK